MNRFKTFAAVAAAAATLTAGAASAYPVVVAAPGPVVVSPYAGPYYTHPRRIGGIYYRYPFVYRGVRYYGPHPNWWRHYRNWGRRWR